MYVNGRFFDALGVRPYIGRTFTPEDDRRGGGPDGPVAVFRPHENTDHENTKKENADFGIRADDQPKPKT
jgi:hypothetical protein